MKDIVIKADTLHKSLYLIPIIILIAVIVAQYFYPHCSACSTCGTAGNSSTQLTAESLSDQQKDLTNTTSSPKTEEQPKEETETQTETTETNTTQNTTVTNTSSTNTTTTSSSGCTPTDVSNKIELLINKITYIIKGEDWAKVTKVSYTIKNGKIDFKPTLRVYVYDENDDETDKDVYKEVLLTETLAKSCEITKESVISSGISYNEINKTKTLKLEVLDEDSNSLASVTKTFKTE